MAASYPSAAMQELSNQIAKSRTSPVELTTKEAKLNYMGHRDDEIETTIDPSKDGIELTIKLKNLDGKKLTMENVILELEYVINQLARADDELSRPGVQSH